MFVFVRASMQISLQLFILLLTPFFFSPYLAQFALTCLCMRMSMCVCVLSVCVCVCDPSVLLHSLITRCGSGQVEGEENVVKSRECHESCQCQSPPSPSPSSPLLPSSSQTPPSNQDSRGEVLAGQSSPRGDCRQAITSRH